ncbi:hypothetical protein CROQUDRAFT_665197, partial [Cronartium quercuum f. sp. fusiforme G11]
LFAYTLCRSRDTHVIPLGHNKHFGSVLIGTRRRLIPSPTTHLRSSSGRTSTRRTRSSPSIGSVFSPPVLLHWSIRDRPASSSLILHPIQSLRPLNFPRFPSNPSLLIWSRIQPL